jgi:hypothetical protein
VRRRNKYQGWQYYLAMPTEGAEPMTAEEVKQYRASLPPDDRTWRQRLMGEPPAWRSALAAKRQEGDAWTWTDERTEELKRLWAEGDSASIIAAHLGTSKGAVIGKVSRLKLPSRETLAKLPVWPEARRQRLRAVT